MKIYTFPLSPPAQLVVNVAKHLGLPFEDITVNIMTNETHTEDYKTKNPQAKVPTLVDGDLVIAESMAIVRYLADKAGETSVYPSDFKQRALVDMHLSNMNDIRRIHLALNYAKVVQPNYWTDRPPVPEYIVANAESTLEALLNEYNTLLGDKDYIVLDQLTLADFVLAIELLTLVIYQHDYQTKQPNLARWLTNLQEKHIIFKDFQNKYNESLEALTKVAEAAKGEAAQQ